MGRQGERGVEMVELFISEATRGERGEAEHVCCAMGEMVAWSAKRCGMKKSSRWHV